MPVKDNQGRWQFLDFSYFLPYAMFVGTIKDAADLKVQKFLSSTGIFGAPLPQLVAALATNIDPFTQREIVNEFDPPAKKSCRFYGLFMENDYAYLVDRYWICRKVKRSIR